MICGIRIGKVVLLVAVTSALAAGCAASEDAGTTTTAAAPTTATTAAPTTAAPTTTATPTTEPASDDQAVAATITISGFSFGRPITIVVGDTVRVTNDDPFNHTWTADDGSFGSGGLSTGESYDFTFEAPGVYPFHCSIHRDMTGSVTVEG
jgi:plastocyanin